MAVNADKLIVHIRAALMSCPTFVDKITNILMAICGVCHKIAR